MSQCTSLAVALESPMGMPRGRCCAERSCEAREVLTMSVIVINVSSSSTSNSHNKQAAAATSACKMKVATAASRELELAETTEEALTSLAKAARALSCMCFPFPRSSQVYRLPPLPPTSPKLDMLLGLAGGWLARVLRALTSQAWALYLKD